MVSIQEAKVKDKVVPVAPVKYDVKSSIELPSYGNIASNVFSEVIETRCSRRKFLDISLEQLGPLLYLSSRTKEAITNDYGLVIEKRNSPSCGAMHTIDCIVSRFGSECWYVYNSRNHSLDQLNVDSFIINQFKLKCQGLIDYLDSGYLIWYVCDLERLSCKYENAEFLALRESGALAATQGLIAESYGLAFCMLGLMGNEEAKALSNQRNLLGVGVAVVGGIIQDS